MNNQFGDILEGELYENANGTLVVMTDKGERSIEALLKKYEGSEVRFTFAKISDLEELRELVKQEP